MRQWTVSDLVYVMACSLAITWSNADLQLDPEEQISVKL